MTGDVMKIVQQIQHKRHVFPGCMVALVCGLSACQAPAPTQSPKQEIAGELSVQMQDMNYEPARLDVPRQGRYRLKVYNSSSMPHDLTLDDGTVVKAGAGETVSAEIEVPASGMGYRCSVPGHEQAGMVGDISVNGQMPSKKRAHWHKPVTAIEPEYMDPRAPNLLSGNVHNIELVVHEKEKAIAKDMAQNLWGFNGQVPGPVIRVKVGDTVRVHLVNPASNKLAHSVDFHASQVAWNDEMTSIKPGEDKLYEWRADYAGVWMYHCGTNPALHHIANGMYGMVIVEPKEGLAPVDHEFALVQSEFYTGNYGQETDYQKAALGNPAPDFVVFNGVAMQYKEKPIEVDTGKKVRFYVLNAGPNQDSAFHIVGTIFNRVIKEGIELSPDNQGHWGAQVVDLAPAQGAIVELTTAEDGLYPIVTHAFNYVGKGALGLLKAGDGNPKD